MMFAIFDQLGHCDQFQSVLCRELHQLGNTGHRTVFVHDLADDRRRIKTGQNRQIDRSFGMSCAPQHAAFPVSQREHMPRATDVRRSFCRVQQRLYRQCPLMGGNAGRDVESVDRNRECGAMRIGIIANHRSDSQFIQPFAFHRNADQPPGMFGHEIDNFRRRHRCGDNQVSFVLAILVIHDNDHLSSFDVCYCFFNRTELRFHFSLPFLIQKTVLRQKIGANRLFACRIP